MATTSSKIGRAELLSRAIRRVVARAVIAGARSNHSYPKIFCLPDDLIGTEVIACGTFEEEYLTILQDEVLKHVAGLQLSPEARTVALDVGSNIGSHALSFSTYIGRVLCFEPNPPIFHVCLANILINERRNVEVSDVALSDKDGSDTLFVDADGNLGSSSLNVRPANVAREVNVKVRRGDQYLQNVLQPRDRVVLVKIDVEGHESNVVRGLQQVLRTHQPIVAFEASSRSMIKASVDALRDAGYQRFCYVRRNWSHYGDREMTKLAAVMLGRTSIDLVPVDLDADAYYNLAIAYPG